MSCWWVLLGLALALTARAQTSVGFSTGVEQLSNNSPDWRESVVLLRHQSAPRQQFETTLTRTERFDLRDTRLALGYSHPITEKLVGTVDANASDTHRVLPRNAFGGTLQYEFAPAWLVHGGARTTRYDDVRVNQGLLLVERYVGAISFAAGLRPARAFGTTAHSGELRAAWYYSDRNSVSLILAAGEEATSVGSDVVLADVRSAVITGLHALNRNWALTYAVGHTRQGDFYTRNGVSVGVQYTF